MNRYIVVDLEEKVIYSINSLEDLVNGNDDRFGGSVTCRDYDDIIQELKEEIKWLESLKD